MKKEFLLRMKSVLILPLLFLLFTAVGMTGQAQTLSINKLDYAPGETVYITGTGWIGDDVVILQVFNETFPGLNYTAHYADWEVYPDPVTGNFTATWDVTDDELNTSLVLTADGQVSGFKYKIFFTDASTKILFQSATVTGTSTICSGSTSILGLNIATCNPTGSGDYTISSYQWQQSANNSSWGDISGATSSTYSASPTITTYYRCIITLSKKQDNCDNTNAVYTTASFTLNVNNISAGIIAKGAVQPGPGCGALDPGITAVTTAAVGSEIITYSWEQSSNGGTTWALIPGATSDQYNPNSFTTTTSFRRIATSTLNSIACSATSNVLEFVVNPVPTVTSITPGGTTNVCVGSTLQLSNATTGGIWGTTTPTLVSVSTTGLVSGILEGTANVIYTVTNEFGCSTTRNKTVNVFAQPSAPTAVNYNAAYDGAVHTGSATVNTGEEVVWYANATGSATATAPTGTNFGTYTAYAEARNTTTGCTSATRTLVTVNISKKALTVTANNQSKTYGSAFTFAGTEFTTDGLVNGNTVTAAVIASDAAAATALYSATPYDINISAATGTGLDNYAITYVKGAFAVTKKPITGNFTVDATKVYDGGTLANVLTRTLNNVEVWDVLNVSLTGGIANYNNKHVGTGKVVTLTGMSLSGTAAGNYSLTGVATTTANITQRPINVTAQTDNRVYNGTTSSAVAPVVGSLQTGDAIGTTPIQVYDTRNVGTAKTMTASGLVINDGNSGNNYSITYHTNTTGVITQKSITVTAVTNTKVYDGNTSAIAVPTYPAFQTGDVLGTAPVEVYDTPLAGTGKIMTASGLVINDGNGSNNYLINYVTNNTGVITQASTTTALTLSAPSVRYMDNLTMTARIEPLNTASVLTGEVEFFIGKTLATAISYGKATVVSIPNPLPIGIAPGTVEATIIKQVTNLPDGYNVYAVFASSNANYSSGDPATKSLTVLQRNADPYSGDIGFYTGTLFAWTTNSSTSTATITLATTIKDNNAPRGDMRGAKVTFYLVNGTSYTPINGATNLPVGLVDVNDGSVGTASAIIQFNIGSANATSYQIAVGVSGAYFNAPGSATAQGIVTISKPVPGGYMVTGGRLSNSSSSGYIKGHTGFVTDFESDIQYTKSGTNPKGKATVLVRSYYKSDGTLDSKLHTYLISTNAIAALNVAGSAPATATFSAKANLVEQLDNLSTVAIEGGSTFEMVATQSGCTQTVGITLYRKAGGVWFSSYWNGTKTIPQSLSGGLVSVAGGGTCSNKVAFINDPVAPVTIVEPTFRAYPSPFTERLNIEFSSANDTQAKLEIFNIAGSKLETLYNGPVNGGQLYQVEYTPRLVSSQMLFYHLTLNGKTQVGKVLYNERR